jgi:predicted 3-demethylubiquinone-9 3-methyltransferase (glyoxalase superfamily)
MPNALTAAFRTIAPMDHNTEMKPKNTICLWFNEDAQDAARFYAATFPDSKVSAAGASDRWGLSWQITPRVLTDALAAGGAEAKRAFEAMMPMKKIDVAVIESARRG